MSRLAAASRACSSLREQVATISNDGRNREDTVVRLRMARVFDEMPSVPVRFAGSTGYGSAIAYLFRAKLDAGGLKRELRPSHGRKRRR